MRRGEGGEGGGEGGGGQCGGAGEQQVSRDGGEDEERQGRPAAEVREDGRGDDLPRRPRENVRGLDGGEDGGEDGGVKEACVWGVWRESDGDGDGATGP